MQGGHKVNSQNLSNQPHALLRMSHQTYCLHEE